MAFSLGLTLAQAKLTKKQFVMSVLVFSLASPLGMAIGIFLSDLDRSLGVDFANAILQTIAGGTFLYVTFFEVLPHEFNQPKNRMLKVLFVLLGFSCIAGLIFITHWNDIELGEISRTKNEKHLIFVLWINFKNCQIENRIYFVNWDCFWRSFTLHENNCYI